MNPTVIDAQVAAGAPPGVLARSSLRRAWLSPAMAGSAENLLRPQPPWWLWPHLLSLDAPLVALVWQRWWAHVVGVTLPVSREIVLGLGVWLIYLADRLADTAGSDHGSGAARHVFSGDRRRFLWPLAALIALALTLCTPRWLPGTEFRAGLALLALAMGYFWLIHCRSGRGWAAFLPKEAVVGGMFAAGTSFFVACRSPHLPATVWLGPGLFAGVCFLNCALITKWERHARDLRERSSLLNAFPRLTSGLRTACAGLAVVALAVSGVSSSPAAVPLAVSALLLALLDASEPRLSSDALRVLADMVLLTPALAWAWPVGG